VGPWDTVPIVWDYLSEDERKAWRSSKVQLGTPEAATTAITTTPASSQEDQAQQ
jgi:hypothetical protein